MMYLDKAIKIKFEASHAFQVFEKQVELQTSQLIKMVRIDGGWEFKLLIIYLTSAGIKIRYSGPHTHEQNGVVECKHMKIVEVGLTSFSKSNCTS